LLKCKDKSGIRGKPPAKINTAPKANLFEIRMRAAIIADKYLSTGFRLVGVEPLFIENVQEAGAVLDEILEDEKYKVVILPENVAYALKEKREEMVSKGIIFPVFVIVPDFEGSKRLREKELYEAVGRAIGAKLGVKA
jgi:vacuolar-type H+-ATPase subunit F/Vma7